MNTSALEAFASAVAAATNPIMMVEMIPIIKKYLRSKHQDLCKIVCNDGFINPADTRLAYYGGLDALLTQVKEFMNFPGSLEKFETELSALYLMTPNIHSSLTNQKYIYKSQLLAILQKIGEVPIIQLLPREDSKYYVLHSIIAIYLRTKESQMKDPFELMTYDDDQLAHLEAIISVQTLTFQGEDLDPSTSLENIIAKFKALLPTHPKDQKHKRLQRIIEEFHSSGKNVIVYENLLFWTTILVTEFDRFFAALPAYQGPTLVRVFHDDFAGKFVLERELLGLGNPETVEIETLRTVDFKKIREWQKENNLPVSPMGPDPYMMDQYEFVIMRIPRTFFRSIPIPAWSRKYFHHVTEVLIEILRDIISIRCVFQNLPRKRLEKLFVTMKETMNQFTETHPAIQLITESEATGIREAIEQCLLRYKVVPGNLKRIREIEGFHLKHLKEELKRLGVVSTFPDIVQVANDLFHGYHEDQLNDRALTTFDMYQAVEKCRLSHIVCKSETRSFFHKFNSCQKVHCLCAVCDQSK
ncbi:hypothetical protein L5515_006428 [Caenorhabditis briggsae]|uniref:DUF7809 domain-containing protein n=1 Tax=Caenorhabditis briggsae TaxID=6238 RepID=A0AAE9F1L4_CAEBR|nr:hypothetical protein L5515_006428 [Caenorhabditis briggsae]